MTNMSLHFSLSKVPELAGLTPLRKKLVCQCAMEALLAEEPALIRVGAFWVVGGILGGVVAGWMAVNGWSFSNSAGWAKNLLVLPVCGLAGALIGNLIANPIFHARLRPYIRRVLEERKEEIAQLG
jgi:hypothetical protein